MSDEVRYVRLRHRDKDAGLEVARYSHRYSRDLQFYSFDEPGIWNRVPLGLAKELEKVRQNPLKPNSPFVFDVCTEAEARRLDAVAKAEREAQKAKVEPSVDTAKDVAVGPGRGDLSLEEVTAGRREALEDVERRAAGTVVEPVDFDPEPEPEPEPPPPPKLKARKPRTTKPKRKK